MRTITIEKKLRGYSVTVGCQVICFGETDYERNDMITWLSRYVEHPETTEQDFLAQYPLTYPVERMPMEPAKDDRCGKNTNE